VTETPEFQPRPVSLPIPLHQPVVTWVLLALIGVAFVVETLAGGSQNTGVLVRLGAKVTPLIAAGEYWRLLTAMFLHIGLMHLLFNGYALFIIGTELEQLLGAGRFLAIYLLAGLGGNLASYAFSPNLAAGASGAVFGLIGALAAFFALHRETLGAWGQRRFLNIAGLIVINLIFGFVQPGIDNLAHLGGLLCGLVLGWALAPRYRINLIERRLEDENRLPRYGPTLAAVALILVGGVALATLHQRDSVQSSLWRAEQSAQQQDWEQVIVEVEQALARDPDLDDPTVYFFLGLAHSYEGNLQSAADAYEQALVLDPNDGPARWNLALSYLQMGQYEQARSHFETYRTQNPQEANQVQPYLDEIERLTR